jgi:hypothetical protein
VLASRPTSAATRRDGLPATWVLALHAPAGPPARVELDLGNTYDEVGLRDGISTTLEVANGRLRTSIAYSHTGGGDDCEQRASFDALATTTPELAIERVERSAPACR